MLTFEIVIQRKNSLIKHIFEVSAENPLKIITTQIFQQPLWNHAASTRSEGGESNFEKQDSRENKDY